MLFEMLSLMWSYSSCGTCPGACAMERIWMMGYKVVGGQTGVGGLVVFLT